MGKLFIMILISAFRNSWWRIHCDWSEYGTPKNLHFPFGIHSIIIFLNETMIFFYVTYRSGYLKFMMMGSK